MFRIVFLFLTFSIPSTLSCDVSFWVGSLNATCSSSPNETYSALNYNGTCTPTPDSPKSSYYSLIIDTQTKIVSNFTIYNGKVCESKFALFAAKTPVPLDTCAPLYFVSAPSTLTDIGSLIFTCK
mgnify:CR=1 FL=1